MPRKPRQRYIVGVDLGGTNIVSGSAGRRHAGVRVQSQPTRPELGADAVVDRIARMVDESLRRPPRRRARRARTSWASESAPPVHSTARVASSSSRPTSAGATSRLRDAVATRVGLPATLDNDANCATVGEWWRGAAQGARHVIGVTIGTGIGGGLIVGGELYHGASDVAGEIGHTTIDSTGRRCKCGNYGCLEAYASGPAIAERAREALDNAETSLLRDLVDGDLSRLTARDCLRRRRRAVI